MAAKKRRKGGKPAKWPAKPRKPRRPAAAPAVDPAPSSPPPAAVEPPAKRPRGGQTIRTRQLEDEIIDWISDGKTLRAFCRQPGKPGHVTVHEWRKADPAFAERFARAREIGADQIAEEALEIADTPEIGEIVEEGEDPDPLAEPAADGAAAEPKMKRWRKVRREDMLGHRKLRFEARVKLLAKWFPKLYGDKIDVEHKGTLSFDDMVRKAMGLPVEGELEK